jgi:hypothetical protein
MCPFAPQLSQPAANTPSDFVFGCKSAMLSDKLLDYLLNNDWPIPVSFTLSDYVI